MNENKYQWQEGSVWLPHLVARSIDPSFQFCSGKCSHLWRYCSQRKYFHDGICVHCTRQPVRKCGTKFY